MDLSRFLAIEELFHRALEVPEGERQTFLLEVCGGDDALRKELESLLRASTRQTTELGAPAPVATGSLAPPEFVGPYRILSVLGHGGTSVVYRAEQVEEGFRREVALKVVAGGFAEHVLRRFEAEKRILASLEHPGIARLYGAGRTSDGVVYLAMELVPGADLVRWCRERALGVEARVRLVLRVLAALDYAHRNLVVHRDLKPANILVSSDGTPKLLDFGIAALLDPTEGVVGARTATQFRALTPAYASPEQIRGERVATTTDVYSLGVVLYELLTGSLPHASGRGADGLLARAFLETAPRPPSAELRRIDRIEASRLQLSVDLDAIVLKALRAQPTERYRSAVAFAEDLERYLQGRPVEARRRTFRYRTARFLRRHAVGVTATASLAGLAVAGLTVHFASLARERDRAAAAATREKAAAEGARREAARAERVVRLVAEVLEAGNPIDQPGRPLSAVELFRRGEERVHRELTTEPEAKAELDVVLGGVWLQLGDGERATALVEPAARELERRLGPRDPATARAWTALATCRRNAGRLLEARLLCERALAVERRAPRGGGAALAETLRVYGDVLMGLGDNGSAKAALEESLGLLRREKGPAELATSRVLQILGQVLERMADVPRAILAIEESVRLQRKIFGPDSPRVATTLLTLAQAQRSGGRPKEALATLLEMERIDRANFGVDRQPWHTHLDVLGRVYTDLGRFVEARAVFRRAIEATRRVRGPDDARVAVPMRGLAEVERLSGRTREARRLHEEVLAHRRKTRGPIHWEVAQSLQDLARVAEMQRDDAAEERYLREVLALFRSFQGESHEIPIARTAAPLGACLCRQGKREEGLRLFDEALRLAAKVADGPIDEANEWRRQRDACAERRR